MRTKIALYTLLIIALVGTTLATPIIERNRRDHRRDQDSLLLKRHFLLSQFLHSPLRSIGHTLGFFKCRIAVISARVLLRQYYVRELSSRYIIRACITFNIATPEVCQGFVHTFKNEVFDVLSYGLLSPHKLCTQDINVYHNWTVYLPQPSHAGGAHIPVFPEHVQNTLRILHFTDIHLDRNYKEGSSAHCLEPVCCHQDSTISHNRQDAKARPLGEYTCDTPPALLDSVLNFISTNLTGVDIIYWTGDSGPHDDWRQSAESQAFYIKHVLTHIRERFPHIRVYPALGNHDTFPVDSFPSPSENEFGNNLWVYNLFTDINTDFLPQQALRTTRWGGFYSVLIKKGLRLVSINTNFCEVMNLWMIINNEDPFNQLHWLVDVLYAAEIANEKVHIIGHHPPGSRDCEAIWSYNFNRILSRFSNTVVALFTGHEHVSSFQLTYNLNNRDAPENIIYIGPSVSPYNFVNPAFNVYDVDDSATTDFVVYDFVTYSLNIDTPTNTNPATAQWKKTFPGVHHYQMPNAAPHSFKNLVKRMADNDTLYKDFMWNYDRRGVAYGTIDKSTVLCLLQVSVSSNHETCFTKATTSP